jgi:hypothetical protein
VFVVLKFPPRAGGKGRQLRHRGYAPCVPGFPSAKRPTSSTPSPSPENKPDVIMVDGTAQQPAPHGNPLRTSACCSTCSTFGVAKEADGHLSGTGLSVVKHHAVHRCQIRRAVWEVVRSKDKVLPLSSEPRPPAATTGQPASPWLRL